MYDSNPSIPSPHEIKRSKRTLIGNEYRGLVVDNYSGELLGHGGAIAYEWEEVDKHRFVKLYLDGLKRAAGLSKAGLSILEVVYYQVRENPNSDKVELSLYTASQQIDNLTDRTYQRGLRELLEKEFLFRSPIPGLFFFNIRFMFNGDRLAFVKGYKLREDQPKLPGFEESASQPPHEK